MQLVFTVDEFMTLVPILRECEADAQMQPPVRDSCRPILQKLLDHDFGFAIDELEDLEGILQKYGGTLRQGTDSLLAQDEQTSVAQRKHTFDRIREKVRWFEVEFGAPTILATSTPPFAGAD